MAEPLRRFPSVLCVGGLVLSLLLPGVAAMAELRDPTLPPATGAPSPGDRGAAFDPGSWKLTATLVGSGRAVAVINNRLVGLGEQVDGARVLAIDPGRVRLRLGAVVWVIHEIDKDVKKPSRSGAFLREWD